MFLPSSIDFTIKVILDLLADVVFWDHDQTIEEAERHRFLLPAAFFTAPSLSAEVIPTLTLDLWLVIVSMLASLSIIDADLLLGEREFDDATCSHYSRSISQSSVHDVVAHLDVATEHVLVLKLRNINNLLGRLAGGGGQKWCQ